MGPKAVEKPGRGRRTRHRSVGGAGERPWMNDRARRGAGRKSRWGQWHGGRVHETVAGKRLDEGPKKVIISTETRSLGKFEEMRLGGQGMINNRLEEGVE